MWQNLVMRLFVWAGSRCFPIIVLYSPDGENVLAIHFAADELTLRHSCRNYLLDSMAEEVRDE